MDTLSRSNRLSLVVSLLFATGLGACSGSSGGSGSPSEPGSSGSSGSSSGSGSSGGTANGTSGSVGAICSASAPCASGLTCAQSGPLLGRCTADCSANLDLCATTFGANTVCMDAAQCAVVCNSDADCPGSGQCVLLTGGVSACATNPDGPPGASPPPNGGCYNLGGAFGDVVANGGYRCTPTTGQDAVLTMDKCVNGTWMSMVYDCTCQVTSSISGSQDPSSCTDFEVPNAARCEYALDFCAQCDPSSGCQSH